jgi:hypothetical protein
MNSVAVFVHLGKSPVNHLWLNLQRHQRLFPQIKTYLILDEKRHLKNVPSGIEIYFFKRESNFLDESVFNAHDQKFRRGFWRFSLERLFALAEFHKSIPQKSILHIESDVFLLANFPWSTLSSVETPMWNNYNFERDVSALLFYPNYQAHAKTIRQVQELLVENPGHTDMTILAELRNRYSDEYNFFPSLSNIVAELKNSLNQCESKFIERLKCTDIFENGVFDAAPIGMWLLGHDPRNNYGKAFIHDPSPIASGDSIVDPSSVGYEMDDQGNLFLVSKLSGLKINLWCLHVHSKSLQIFSKNWDLELRKFVHMTNTPFPIAFFSKSALWNMLTQSMKGRTFMRFLIGLPLIHRVRRWISPVKHSILSKYRT